MSPEEYQQRMQELGVERGWLEESRRCPCDIQSVTSVYRAEDPKYLSDDKRQFRLGSLEDLSHLNPRRPTDPWITPEKKQAWLAKRRATVARKAAAQ